MIDTEKLILNESLNKKSKNENATINLNFSGNKRILPETSIDATIDSYDVYLNERKKSNKFRVTININPYCTNVLFNPFTEIVMHNDNGSIGLLNYFYNPNIEKGVKTQELIDKEFLHVGDVVGKASIKSDKTSVEDFVWTPYKAIRDTQLSNKKCGFEYYCGIDIFNNHIIRNKTYKSVSYSNLSTTPLHNYVKIYGSGYSLQNINAGRNIDYNYVIPEFFNTIDDYMRDRKGVVVSKNYDVIIKNITDTTGTNGNKNNKCAVKNLFCPLHLYQNFDVYTYEQSVENNLKEKNGWFGFYNKSNTSFITFVGDGEYYYDINKVINSAGSNDFIDMYPTRSHYSFSPYYNTEKERIEKNWNYCLTYPSESIVRMFNGTEFSFFKYIYSENSNKESIALKVLMIDEYTVDDDGRSVVTVYSICQHGLKSGDKVNIYVNGEIFYDSVGVSRIIDKYIFQFYKQSENISNEWIDLNDESIIEVDSNNYRVINFKSIENGVEVNRKLYDNVNFLFENENKARYYIAASNRCNVDKNAQDISFKRVVNNVECKYYVRVFSRLPNFKFKDAEINDETLYGESSEDLDLINRFSDPSIKTNDFENHISKLSFSETAYGDDNTEIVYTDDIDVSHLRDNLGRPLSEIFFTVVKNNNGYKKWYGINGTKIDVNDDSIEKSHCFGKNNCSFLLSDYYINYMGDSVFDVREISLQTPGLKFSDGDDEIVFDDAKKFYGDLCCYSPIDCDEQIIQSVHNRFNTVQRELKFYNNTEANKFFSGKLYYDEILEDESSPLDLTKEGEKDTNNIDFYSFFNESNPKYKLRHSTYSKSLLDNAENLYFDGMTSQAEGYYYKSHYKIRLKTISQSINYDNPIKYDIYEIKNSNGSLEIKTFDNNFFGLHEKLILYLKNKNIYYYLTVKEIFTEKYFSCYVNDEDYNSTFVSNEDLDKNNLSLVKKGSYVPYYAKLIKDGSCRFYWREVISNGIEEGDSKIYPFTNGAFYINKNINFYLKRQDIFKEHSYSSVEFGYIPNGQNYETHDTHINDNYYEAGEIETC